MKPQLPDILYKDKKPRFQEDIMDDDQGMKPQWRNVILWALVAALVIACATAYYFYRTLAVSTSNSQAAASQAQQAQVQALMAKVGQLIVLPQDETPTIATVVNPDALKSQPFFANAVKGDIVFIYTSAKKAILYDPNLNKIIEVAPIAIGNPVPTPTPTTTKTK